MKKGHEIKVLDHGYVRLIDWMGTDELMNGLWKQLGFLINHRARVKNRMLNY